MISSSVALFLAFFLSAHVVGTTAETHTVTFDNQCGYGTPRLIQNGNIISTGEPFTSNGPFSSGIAYLQTGNCLLNGEGCTLVEMTLNNPTCAGCGSSTDISLIPPHAYVVPVSFSYSGGCNGQGATCTSANCNTAFFVPDDNQVQVECQENNVNLLISFCGSGTGGTLAGTSTVSSSHATKISTTVEVATPKAATSTSASIKSPISTPPLSVPKCSARRSTRRRSLPVLSELVARIPSVVHEHRRIARRRF